MEEGQFWEPGLTVAGGLGFQEKPEVEISLRHLLISKCLQLFQKMLKKKKYRIGQTSVDQIDSAYRLFASAGPA